MSQDAEVDQARRAMLVAPTSIAVGVTPPKEAAALLVGGRIGCSAVRIDARVVLTAAHCVADHGVDEVFFGTSLDTGGAVVTVADIRVHASFDGAALDADLALLLLDELPAADSVSSPYGGRVDLVDRRLRFGGFGKTVDGTGEYHEGIARVEDAGETWFTAVPDPATPCMGDSGGPAWRADNGVFVGIVSSGNLECTTARFIRLSGYIDTFIDPYIDAVNVQGSAPGDRCFIADNCAQGVCYAPEDAPSIRYCTEPCATDTDCAAPMACGVDGLCVWQAPSPGAVGSVCSEDYDCDTRICAVEGAGGGICATRCFPDDTQACPLGLSCVADGAHPPHHACIPASMTPSGCQFHGGGSADQLFLFLTAAVFVVARLRAASSPGYR